MEEGVGAAADREPRHVGPSGPVENAPLSSERAAGTDRPAVVPPASPDAQSPRGPDPARLELRLQPRTLRTVVFLLVALVLGAILYLARGALAPLVIGMFLVYLLDPVVSRLHRGIGLPRWTGVLGVFAALVAVLALLVRVTVGPLADQVSALIQRLPDIVTSTIRAVETTVAQFDLLPAGLRAELVASLERLAGSVGSDLNSLDVGALLGLVDPGAIAGSVVRLASAVLAYAVIPIFVFYILKDRPALSVAGRNALPPEWRPDLDAMIRIVDRVFGRWIRGQLILGLVVGVMTFAGLLVLGVLVDPVFRDFAVILAVIAGLLELLPIIGPIISAVPAVLLGATAGAPGIIAAVLLYLGVQQLENNVLVPKIQGDATDLHPGIVIAAIIIGGTVAGLLGAILALPLAAAARDIVRYLVRRTAPLPMSVDVALAEALQPAAWREVTPAGVHAEEARGAGTAA